jgi:WD40 repeat protein
MGGPLAEISLKIAVPPKAIRSTAISPDGKLLATAGDDGIVRLWEAATFKWIRQLGRQSAAVYSVAFSDNGKLLVSAGFDGSVRVWDLETFTQRQILSTAAESGPVQLYGAAFEPGQNPHFVNAGGNDGNVWIWNLASGLLVKKIGLESPVRSLSFAPRGNGEFASSSFDGRIRFFSAPGRVETVQANTGKLLHVAYSPDAKIIASAGVDATNKAVKIWNATSRSLLRTFDTKYAVSVAWSTDGNRLVAGGYKEARLWDAQSGAQLQYFGGHTDDVESVTFHPNQKWLLSAGEDGTARLWDIASGKLLLSTVAYDNGDYVSYTPRGCYSGSEHAGNYLRFVTQDGGTEQDVTALAKDALYLPGDATAALLPK